MGFANMNTGSAPKPAVTPTTPVAPESVSVASSIAADSTTPPTTPAQTTVAPASAQPKKPKRVHTYKLVITGILGVIGFSSVYTYYSVKYSYTPQEYIATNTLPAIDLDALARKRELTQKEKVQYTKEYLRAKKLARLNAIFALTTSLASEKLPKDSELLAILKSLETEAYEAEKKKIAMQYKLSKEHEKIVGAFRDTAEPPIEPFNYGLQHSIAFEASDVLFSKQQNSLETAAAKFSVAGALGHEKSADISVALYTTFTEKQKDIAAVAMAATLEQYELDESIFTAHAAAEEPAKPTEPVVETPTTNEDTTANDQTEEPKEVERTTEVDNAPKPTPNPVPTPVVVPTPSPEIEPDIPDEVTSEESVKTTENDLLIEIEGENTEQTSSVPIPDSSSSSSYFRVNKRSLRENFRWYQERDR